VPLSPRLALAPARRAAVEAPIRTVTATVEMAVDALAAPIETPVDAVTAIVEALGGYVATGRCGSVGTAVEAAVDTVAAPIETVFDTVTAIVETPFDAISAPIGDFPTLCPDLRRAGQQTQREPYCAAFHRSGLPSRRMIAVGAYNARSYARLTATRQRRGVM
jgi:hypothetical protein